MWQGLGAERVANRKFAADLKRMKPGTLRWPGGCYVEFYRWKEGLLPVDQRPPIGPSGQWWLLPGNDDFDPHEIGIDEFIALCREVGSEPAMMAGPGDTPRYADPRLLGPL